MPKSPKTLKLSPSKSKKRPKAKDSNLRLEIRDVKDQIIFMQIKPWDEKNPFLEAHKMD